MLASRWSTSSARVAAATDATNSCTNQGSEYWYMGSMAARSEMQKKSTEVK